MRKYRMQDDSVTVRGKGHPEYSGKSVAQRAEELARKSPMSKSDMATQRKIAGAGSHKGR